MKCERDAKDFNVELHLLLNVAKVSVRVGEVLKQGRYEPQRATGTDQGGIPQAPSLESSA